MTFFLGINGFKSSTGKPAKDQIRRVVYKPRPPARCEGDFDEDYDVDGSDLAALAAIPALLGLDRFGAEFGQIDCH